MTVIHPRQRNGMFVVTLVLATDAVGVTRAIELANLRTFFGNPKGNSNSNRGDSSGQSFDSSPGSKSFGGSNTISERLISLLGRAEAADPISSSCVSDPTTSSATCHSPTMTSPASRISSKLVPVVRRYSSPEDCCVQCASCMDPQTSKSLCSTFPRGGGSSAEAIIQGGISTASTPYGIPLNGWKVIFQAFLTFINVAFWLFPLKSKKMADNELALSLANAFSGGVFLSLAFGHLIPECVHGFHEYNDVMPYMLVLSGYLLIFFVEKVAFDTHEALSEMEGGKGHSSSSSSSSAVLSKGNGNGHVESKESSQTSPKGRAAVILLGALAVHSILEMTALGLADTFADCGLLSLSIALHQPAESIALLVAFIKSGLPESDIIKYLGIFSAMGPIGVGIGMAVNEFAAPIVDSVMLAIVAGTFVYVGATEVIPEEWEDPSNKWKKFGALMAGIISIFGITQYTTSLSGE